MIINKDTILSLLATYNITVKGVLHIGAHECEEKEFYNKMLGVEDSRILWIDGNPQKVNEMKAKGIPNLYCAIIDETERDVDFNITGYAQASSLLRLNHEAGFYKDIKVVKTIRSRTETVPGFFQTRGLAPEAYNFWNLDIQGTELHTLRGAKDVLNTCDAIYTEVNCEEVYKGCGLVRDIDALLGEFGFIRVETKWTEKMWGDALYLKKR